MNGIHDLGGMHGLGPVAPEPDEPIFRADWERRAFALTLACGFLGRWNLDRSRFARELMAPAEYLETSYYEHWLFGLGQLLEEEGLLSRAELEARLAPARAAGAAPARAPAAQDAPPLRAADVAAALSVRRTARSDAPRATRFRVGQRVRSHNDHPRGHTRLPRYARGRVGEIAADHGVWVFPDSHAAGAGPNPQHCYSVAFTARELWGERACEGDRLYLDLFEDYLDPA